MPQKKVKVEMVGHYNTMSVDVNGVPTQALIDTGSQITTISSLFMSETFPEECIGELADLITVRGAGGNVLPYKGYVNLDITIAGNTYAVPTLVMENNLSSDVPIIVGTNVLSLVYKDKVSDSDGSSLNPQLCTLMKNMAKVDVDMLGTVKTTRETTIQPGQVLSVKGLSRAYSGGTSTSRVFVDILNTSSKAVTIPSKYEICQLYRVDVVKGSEDQLPEIVTEDDIESSLLNQFSYPEDEQQAKSLKKLLVKWKHVFAVGTDDHGRTDAVKHTIKLTDETPIKIRHRRIPPSMYSEVKEHLEKMLRGGDIRPSKSPWSFPAVLVRKRDSSLRFCVDYRELNKRTVRDALSMPRIEETLDALIGAKFFSCLDLKNGFWQIKMSEEDREKTAFTLGHIVSEHGIQTDPEKVSVVENWPAPTCTKSLQRYLGFIGFYHYTLPFELHVDACTSGLGSVLYQRQNGTMRVIAYASRGLSNSERNYPAHKLEFLALKWAL
ncbi:hypothetical protein ScPMuIL_007053, partial [Solemya velum]